MKRAVLLAASLLALAACEGRNPTPALEAPAAEAVTEDLTPEAAEPAFAETAQGLELFDSESGISVLDVGPQDAITGLAPPKFALHCNTAAKTLEVVAPARQLGPYALAGPAQYVVSGTPFDGEAVLTDSGGAAVSLTLPLTPELLAATATAITARLVISDGFAESNADTNGAFPGFAGQCSLKSGVPLPVR
jgi:hypothetical protein